MKSSSSKRLIFFGVGCRHRRGNDDSDSHFTHVEKKGEPMDSEQPGITGLRSGRTTPRPMLINRRVRGSREEAIRTRESEVDK